VSWLSFDTLVANNGRVSIKPQTIKHKPSLGLFAIKFAKDERHNNQSRHGPVVLGGGLEYHLASSG
jgi:hypothetical protein